MQARLEQSSEPLLPPLPASPPSPARRQPSLSPLPPRRPRSMAGALVQLRLLLPSVHRQFFDLEVAPPLPPSHP